MTKKDYILIARVLSSTRAFINRDVKETDEVITNPKIMLAEFVEVIAQGFAMECIKDNPRFDKEKFMKACLNN